MCTTTWVASTASASVSAPRQCRNTHRKAAAAAVTGSVRSVAPSELTRKLASSQNPEAAPAASRPTAASSPAIVALLVIAAPRSVTPAESPITPPANTMGT